MAYGRNDRQAGSQGEYYGARDPQDTDYLSDRRPDGRYSSAGDYAAAGQYGDNDRGASQRDSSSSDYGRSDYGAQDYGNARYGQRERQNAGRSFQHRAGGSGQGGGRDYHRSGSSDRGQEDRGPGDRDGGGQRYGAQPQDHDDEDRGFLARAGDEVRSWFGDDDAERRRSADSRYDERQDRQPGYGRDDDYHQWRKGQIDALDRDYHEYRQENRTKFANEFGSWRSERQTQRGSLSNVKEHMDVVGSDGEHIGTVDKVRGDRILLTRNDADAGGRHHSIPSRWIDSVDDKIKVRKTAEEAKAHWRDEEDNQAIFGDDDAGKGRESGNKGPGILNRSFSGTY